MKIRLTGCVFLLSLLIVTSIQAKSLVPGDARSLYKEECSGCHIAYPAWLLPARSWNRIMTNLNNHFGDNASLDAESRNILNQYLQKNSVDNSNKHHANRIKRSIKPGSIPTRITELRYFKREHRVIPSRLVKANPRVKSLSNCESCHQGVEQGSFNEHQIHIPGYGQWDD